MITIKKEDYRKPEMQGILLAIEGPVLEASLTGNVLPGVDEDFVGDF